MKRRHFLALITKAAIAVPLLRHIGAVAQDTTNDVSVFDYIPSAERAAIVAGTSSYNATTAFYAASQAIQAAGGGKLRIPKGVYNVGAQIFAGSAGKGYSYLGQPIISIESCTKPVLIEGNGAVLRMVASLKFGAFDPVTGEPYPSTGHFTDRDYAATVGHIIDVRNNSSVYVKDVELDGRNGDIHLGGQWGDTGYQIAGSGLNAIDNDAFVAENVYSHHCCLDGVYIRHAETADNSNPHKLTNIVSEYNARQGFSWTGGNNLTVENSSFRYTGCGGFASKPMAGVDVEPNPKYTCRNGTFINCKFENNKGVGLLAGQGDSADIAFTNCTFVGNLNWAIWPHMPRYKFVDCTIVGPFVNAYASTISPKDAVRYTHCLFTDELQYAPTLYRTGNIGDSLSISNHQNNVFYEDCTFNCTRTRPGRFDGAIVKNCVFNLEFEGTSIVKSGDYVAVFSSSSAGGLLEDTTINDKITINLPVSSYHVDYRRSISPLGNNIINSQGTVRWNSPLGRTGILRDD